MVSQRKRLQSYLREKGLEVHGTDGASELTVQNLWGDLSVPDLMDKVLQRENFDNAVQQVVINGGAGGVDRMSAHELPDYVKRNWDEIYAQLRTGRYKPSPVRRVSIPKPDGGERNLGIPTVLDRAVQQAIAQVLTPIYESVFSEHSFGFRPGRGAHDAVCLYRNYFQQGYRYAVDLDLSKYFDTINHEMLMNLLRRTINDETLLITIKRFLKSGVMVDGVKQKTEEGSPQGGNLSPLLANIYLHEFDILLEERGHKFVRYADDIIILTKSERAAERVMKNSVDYLENKLKLKVNTEKSRIDSPCNLKFLGFTLSEYDNGEQRICRIKIHKKSIERFKDKIKAYLNEISNWTVENACTVSANYIRGWLSYFALADTKKDIILLAQWSRRKLRAKLWHQWKTSANRFRKLKSIMDAEEKQRPLDKQIICASILKYARSHGTWHMSGFRLLSSVLSNRYLFSLGFPDIEKMYDELHSKIVNRRIREVRTAV